MEYIYGSSLLAPNNTSTSKQNGFENHIQNIRKVPIDHYETTSSLFHVKDRRFGDCMLF